VLLPDVHKAQFPSHLHTLSFTCDPAAIENVPITPYLHDDWLQDKNFAACKRVILASALAHINTPSPTSSTSSPRHNTHTHIL
jgi:hypothetical protein